MKKLLKISVLSLFVLMLSSFVFADNPNLRCEDIGMDLVAKYEWSGASYVFEEGYDVVTITGNAESASWTSTQEFGAVIIKGGPESYTYEYNPAATSGIINNDGLGGKDISNVQYCLDGQQPIPPPVPEFSTIGMIISIFAVVIVGYMFVIRKRQK